MIILPRHYLDHAATTPCCEQAWNAMLPFFRSRYGNPNSLHSYGREARKATTDALTCIATQLGCGDGEIVFTGGGTESNNLAVFGAARRRPQSNGHILTTEVEHPSTLRACRVLETEGVSVTYLRSDCGGLVKPSEVVAALREDTILITVSHANSEIGCVQPIEAIVEAVKAARPEVLIHVDGVQTVGHMSYDLRHLPIDLLSFTAHKFYGPKGIGGLFIRAGVELSTVRGRGRDDDSVARGTEAVPLIVGMAAALEYSCGRIGFNDSKWLPVRNLVASRLQDDVADCRLNGDPVARLSTNVNISFRGVSGEDLVILLDRCGYAVSTGSACTTGRVDPSHVLLAIGCNREEALGAIRLTFGDASSACNVDDLLNTINELVAGQRALSYRPTRTNSTRERTS